MNRVSDVSFDATRNVLWAVDQNNNRVIGFDLSGVITDGMPASLVLGQPDFTTNTAYTGSARNRLSMDAPNGIYVSARGYIVHLAAI